MTMNFDCMLLTILNILTDNQQHDLVGLQKKLHCGINEIESQIDLLISFGVDIIKNNCGYKLAEPIDLLHKNNILSKLPAQIKDDIALYVASTVASTNDVAKNLSHTDNKKIIVCAEYQTKGRGRREKKWFNKFASSVCMSVHLSLKQNPQLLYGLSIVTGIAVITAINNIKPTKLKLKWPNDIIMLHEKGYSKLGGILIEFSKQKDTRLAVTIGIGLNIKNQNVAVIDNNAIDLQSVCNINIERDTLIAEIITCLLVKIDVFIQNGLEPFIAKWHQLDAFYNKPVVIIADTQKYSATSLGINHDGALIAKIQNKQRIFYSADVSLRNLT